MIGVLASGNGSNLQALLDAGLPVSAVASNRKDAYALVRAREAGIPVATFSLDATLIAGNVTGARDVVGGARGRAGGARRLHAPADRAVPAPVPAAHRQRPPLLLPSFPGAHAIDDALAAGAATTGVTVHLVDEGLDTGPVLAQEAVPVEPRATLVDRIHAVEHRLLPQVVRDLCLAAR